MNALARAGVVCVLVAAGLCAGCGSAAPSARLTPTAHAASLTWAQVANGLRPELDPSSTNPCQRGALSCFDILLAEMARRADVLVAACDHDAVFALTYEDMTAAIRAAARAGRFQNPALMTLFTAWFARMYLQASDDWRTGHRDAVPAAWQVAFSAASQRAVNGFGDLLLGMNAHITGDLPYVVAAVMRQPGTRVNPDYALINQIIIQTSQGVLHDVGSRLDPSVALAQIPIALGAQSSFGELIAQWRSESWRNGMTLRAAAGAQRATVERQINDAADLRAVLIRGATAYLPLIQDSTQRDAFCAAHHGN